MSDYMFIKITDVPGSAKQKDSKDCIEVLSFSHTCSYPISPGDPNTAGVSVSHSAFHFTAYIEKATPKLLELLNQRKQIKDAEFQLYTDDAQATGKGAGGKKLIYKVKLENCRVAAVDIGGSDGGGTPVMNVALSYAIIKWDFETARAQHDFANWKG